MTCKLQPVAALGGAVANCVAGGAWDQHPPPSKGRADSVSSAPRQHQTDPALSYTCLDMRVMPLGRGCSQPELQQACGSP